MADKKLTLGLSVDTKDFDAAIKKMQADIANLQRPSAQIVSPQQAAYEKAQGRGGAGFGAFQAATETPAQRQQRTNQDQQASRFRETFLTRELALQKSITLELQAQAKLVGTPTGGSARGPSGGGSARGGMLGEQRLQHGPWQQQPEQSAPGGKSGFKVPNSLTGLMNLVPPEIKTAIAIGSAVETVRKFYSESSANARVLEASAFQTQGQAGQRFSNIINGGATEESMFNPQRMRANKEANDIMYSRLSSPGRAIFHPIQALTGENSPFSTEATRERVRQERATEQADLQKEQFEAFKNGPEGSFRTSVANKWNQKSPEILAFQRQMGLSENAFRGSFTDSATGAGFTQEQGMGMAGSIMGAGGSTRASTGLAGFGLQAQRNADMTNAGGLIGSLSKGLGSADVTKEAFVKLLAEGTRIGLDGSEYREENRKFTEAAAMAVGQSGATTSAGVDQVMSQFGKFFGSDKTGAGIAAGQSAYQQYQEQSKETTGPRGSMRAAGLLSNKFTKALSAKSRSVLFDMGDDVIEAQRDVFNSMAREATANGVPTTADDLMNAKRDITKKSSNIYRGQDVASNKFSALKKELGITGDIEGYTGPKAKELREAYEDMQAAQAFGDKGLANDPRRLKSRANMLAEGAPENEFLRAGREAGKKYQIEQGETGRAGDQKEKMEAEASKLANQLFIDMRAEIVPTAKAIADFAKECVALRTALRSSDASVREQGIRTFQGGAVANNAPIAGAPVAGAQGNSMMSK